MNCRCVGWVHIRKSGIYSRLFSSAWDGGQPEAKARESTRQNVYRRTDRTESERLIGELSIALRVLTAIPSQPWLNP